MQRRRSKSEGTIPKTASGDEDLLEARDVGLSKEDELLPDGAKPVRPPSPEGEEPDTAGRHGPMAPEAARGIEEPAEE
jgi:hypothetical protein